MSNMTMLERAEQRSMRTIKSHLNRRHRMNNNHQTRRCIQTLREIRNLLNNI